MSLRSISVSLSALCLSVFTALLPAQTPPPQDQPPQTPPAVAAPAPVPTGPKKPAGPDYPDPRTPTVGVFYWLTIPGSGPDIRGGVAATGYETLTGIGKYKPGLDAEISYPITRTGVLRLEGYLVKGDGTQNAPANTTIYSDGFNKGDFLSTQYQIKGAKIYLEDLLYPFKFPVAKFRVRSLWEAQYLSIKSTIDAPLIPTTSTSTSATSTGSDQIILPSFGLAPEYALTPHVLLRAAASGFGLPHKSEIWDAEATVSYRRGKLEVVGGYKILHFKTSPQRDEYVTATIDGGFIGLRWHL